MSEISNIERSDDNQKALDEITLEEADTMYSLGIEFICNNGHITKIVELVPW